MKIKFIAAIAALFCLASTTAVAQKNVTTLPHRISLSYGDGLSYTINLGSVSLFPGLGNPVKMTTSGGVNLDYMYMLPSGKLGLGVGIGLNPITFYPMAIGDDYSYSHLMFSVMPRIQWNYYRSKTGLVELYGNASIGWMTSLTKNASINALAWQIDPIAVRIGSDRIAGFVSAGYGSRGIFNVGIQIGL